MELINATNLIRNEYLNPAREAQTWADLGCGQGLFTRALAGQLPPGSVIYAIDKANHFSAGTEKDQEVLIHFRQQDMEQDLNLPGLDGILMANALHYVHDQESFVRQLKRYLNPGAALLVVEYDTDLPESRWVPYPLSFNTLKLLFQKAGFSNIEQLNRLPSLYGRGDLYSAMITF